MAKKIKLEVGDIFRIKLLNGLYAFGHVIFYVPRKSKKWLDINPESYLVKWFSGCILIDIYSQISDKNTLENKDIFLKGVFLSSTDLATMDEDTITIVDNFPVEIKKIEFPETIGANREDGFFLERGELKLRLGNISNSIREKLMNFPSSFKDIYSITDAVLFFQNRKSEMQRNYYDGWNHAPSDLKYNPELRTKVYKILGEDPNQSYYEMALKHGFDLVRLY